MFWPRTEDVQLNRQVRYGRIVVGLDLSPVGTRLVTQSGVWSVCEACARMVTGKMISRNNGFVSFNGRELTGEESELLHQT